MKPAKEAHANKQRRRELTDGNARLCCLILCAHRTRQTIIRDALIKGQKPSPPFVVIVAGGAGAVNYTATPGTLIFEPMPSCM